ncbi:proline--tRNA ligase [Clostridia bacterium]|nr:proline--tRNA ligase [Clostridia bacterium]
MVIKPYGYAIWENIRDVLDAMFKKTGHQNAYFPLFIPKSFLSKEASHVEGFAKECRIVTHHRLMNNPEGKGVVVDPTSKLEEELIVRPTSETIIRDSFKNWIHSYRDLPMLINQWANVTRAEMRTRPFLRTSEFLWQEGHTAHATAQEAQEEAMKIFRVYLDFAKNFMAMYSYTGEKPDHDRFAGAIHTYAFEPMMQDFKALQAGTSHDLGQNFAKAFEVQFTNKDNVLEYPYASSRGVSTRLIGGLIMAHGDDKGLVLPPVLAPTHLVIVPIFKTAEDLELIKQYLQPAVDQIKKADFTTESEFLGTYRSPIRVKFDDDDQRSPGRKYNEYELKGVPLRIAIGKRDVENGNVELYRRDTGEKLLIRVDNIAQTVISLLEQMQKAIFQAHEAFSKEHTFVVEKYEEFKEKIEQGYVLAHWDGTKETADRIQEETKATIRCLPFDFPIEEGVDILTGKKSERRVIFAKSY